MVVNLQGFENRIQFLKGFVKEELSLGLGPIEFHRLEIVGSIPSRDTKVAPLIRKSSQAFLFVVSGRTQPSWPTMPARQALANALNFALVVLTVKRFSRKEEIAVQFRARAPL